MERLIKLYTYEDGYKDNPFPNSEEPIVISTFEYHANRMGGAPYISATAKHSLCLDDLWTDKVYAEFNGEKFFVINTPSSSKSNADERYVHEIQLLSERDTLNHIYFLDTVASPQVPSCFSTGVWLLSKKWLNNRLWIDRPGSFRNISNYKYVGIDTQISNSTKFQFMGDLKQFVVRLNSSLQKSKLPYVAVLDEGVSLESKLISFQNKYILEALQEAFKVYQVPYYFKRRIIHFGYTENAIPVPIKYGSENALLSVSKNNANYQVINRITGIGSEKNIPYYYPNPTDDRSAIEAAGGKWITPSQNLMPPIYRRSFGEERFYNAKSNFYPTPEGDYYDFENEFSENKQLEGIVEFPEIEPTIAGITNEYGERIDLFSEFAYDEKDDDSYDNENNEYTHSYFFAKMRKTNGEFGFNLFDQANEKQAMQVSMITGVCGSCTFEIGVGEETKKNIVQVDEKGNLLRDKEGNVIRSGKPQERQNDTRNYEVWIALKKDDTTFQTFKPMPNVEANLRPSVNDNFVILGITLPDAYILAAEQKLETSLIKYMWMNNREKFNFSVSFSRIFLAENPDILQRINENARLLIEYNGKEHTFYVDDFSYTMEDNIPLPKIEVNLVDTITVGKNSLQNALDRIKQDILSSIGGGDFLKQGLKYFLRKDVDDIANGIITFRKGLKVGKYVPDTSGAILNEDAQTKQTYMELDRLKVRRKAYFENLEIINVNSVGGKQIISPAGSIKASKVEKVLTESGEITGYKCFFVADVDGEKIENRFHVNDLALCQAFNAKEGVHNKISNKYYWRAVTGKGDDFIILSSTDCDTLSDIPEVGDVICQLGNKDDTDRQNAMVYSSVDTFSPSIILYQGINSYSLANKDVGFWGMDKTTNKAFFNVYGESYIGARSDNPTSFMKYTQDKGLEIRGKIKISNGTSIEDALKDAGEAYKKDEALYGEIKIINDSIRGIKDFTDEAFKDGIVDRSERAVIEGYLKEIETSREQVSKSYEQVYNNKYLKGVAKTNLKIGYDAFDAAITELREAIESTISDGLASKVEKALVDNKYSVFNIKYGDFINYLNAANRYIQEAFGDKLTLTDYIRDALKENTSIQGGLIQSSLLSLGYTENDQFKVMAGTNGIYEVSKKGGGIAAWYGGDMIDKFDYYDYTKEEFHVPDGIRVASGVDRMDGTGYRANGNLWWEQDGTLHADPLSFLVGKETVGALLKSFQVVTYQGSTEPQYIIPKVPFQKLDVSSSFSIGGVSFSRTQDGIITIDGTLAVKGDIVAHAISSSDIPTVMDGVFVDETTITKKDGVLKVIGGSGGGVSASQLWILLGNATSEQINESHISNALSGYATESWVESKGFLTNDTISIMDGVAVDETTITKRNGVLQVIGGSGGGSGSGIDASQLWDILGNSNSEQINETHMSTALSKYAQKDIDQTITGTYTFNSYMYCCDITPGDSNFYDLGRSGTPFKNVFTNRLASATNNDLKIGIGNDDYVCITKEGFVGIGVSSTDNYRLYVAGDTYVAGNLNVAGEVTAHTANGTVIPFLYNAKSYNEFKSDSNIQATSVKTVKFVKDELENTKKSLNNMNSEVAKIKTIKAELSKVNSLSDLNEIRNVLINLASKL